MKPEEGAVSPIETKAQDSRHIRRCLQHKVIHLELDASDDPRDDERNDRDNQTQRHVKQAVAIEEGADKSNARAQADARQEERNAHFAKHQVGRMSRVGNELKLRPPVTQEDGHDQWTAGKTKPQWNGHTRNRDGQKAQQDAQYDAQKNRNDVGVVELLHLVAQTIGQAFDRALRSYTINLIAHLQMQVLVREERHACTKDSCDIDAVIAAQMQFSQAHPVDLILSNQNVAGN